MAEQHNPPHEPQGTGHQEEEQQQLAREAPETHEPRPSQAAAEPQPSERTISFHKTQSARNASQMQQQQPSKLWLRC